LQESSNSNSKINANILMVGMSASSVIREQEDAFEFGMHLVVTKPVELTYLTWMLEERRRSLSVPDVCHQLQLRLLESVRECESSSDIQRNLRFNPKLRR